MARYQRAPDAGWIYDHETDTRFQEWSLHLSCAQAYQAWLAAGNVPDTPEPAAPPVPTEVSAAQGRLALLQAGVLDALEAWITTQPRATQIEYAARGTWRRDWPLVAMGAEALGLTEAQLDELFILAATL